MNPSIKIHLIPIFSFASLPFLSLYSTYIFMLCRLKQKTHCRHTPAKLTEMGFNRFSIKLRKYMKMKFLKMHIMYNGLQIHSIRFEKKKKIIVISEIR